MNIKINQNATALFGSNGVAYAPNTFAQYKSLVELGGMRNRPSELFANGEALRSPLPKRALQIIFSHIAGDKKEGKAAASKMIEFMGNYYKKNPKNSQKQFESDCKLELNRLILDFGTKLNEKLTGSSSRSRLIFEQIRPHLLGNSALDIGAGDGKVGNLISQELKKGATLVDVMDYNETDLPLQIYDGKKLPYKDNSFDASILSVVLHHSGNPLEILQEAIRVTNRRIVVIESIYFNPEHKNLNSILDWFYNRVLHDNVNCPFYFQTPGGWEATFRNYGLKISASIDLGIDQPTVPEYHWLYALDKQF